MEKNPASCPSEYSKSITCTQCNCCPAAYRLADGSPACYTCALEHGHKPRSLTAAWRARQHREDDSAEAKRLLADMETMQLVAQAIQRGEEVEPNLELLDLNPRYTFTNHSLRIAAALFVMTRDFLRGKTPKPNPAALEFDVFLENGLNELALESCLLAQEIKIAAQLNASDGPQHGLGCSVHGRL